MVIFLIFNFLRSHSVGERAFQWQAQRRGATLLICPSIVSALQAMEARAKRLRESWGRRGQGQAKQSSADGWLLGTVPLQMRRRDSQSLMQLHERGARRRCVCIMIPSRHSRSSSVNIYSCSAGSRRSSSSAPSPREIVVSHRQDRRALPSAPSPLEIVVPHRQNGQFSSISCDYPSYSLRLKLRLERAAPPHSCAIHDRLLSKPSPPMRLAGLNPHHREATRSGGALGQGP